MLCLGSPHLHLTEQDLVAIHRQANSDWSATAMVEAASCSPDPAIRGKQLLHSLGFSHVDVLDVSDFEGANVLLDLNSAQVPGAGLATYDLILDHGSIEHVFNLPNALSTLWNLLRVNGRIFHSSPGSNFFDHGFYSLSPTFFHDFYTENGWEIERIEVFRMSREPNCVPFYTPYSPGVMDGLSYGGLDAHMYGTVCVAVKRDVSTADKWPMQSRYKRNEAWRTGSVAQADKPASAAAPPGDAG
jgi:SAM-dependent methyltransferase